MFARVSRWEALTPSARSLHCMRAVQSKHPDWVFSHQSAAVAHGLPIPASQLTRLHVRLPATANIRRSERYVFHACDGPIERVFGVRVTPLLKTVLDCASSLSFRDGLAVADAALRYYGIERAALVRYVEDEGKGRRGVRQARLIARHADGLSESWGESAARALMIQLGFALPRLQAEIDLPSELGGIYRVDFLWVLLDGSYIIGEFDGMVKYRDAPASRAGESLRALVDERKRESRLTMLQVPIIRFTFDDLRDPGRFARLLDAFGVPRERAAA